MEVPFDKFSLAQRSSSQGHSRKLVKKRRGCKQHFFRAKVAERWNELDEEIIAGTTVLVHSEIT